jgi:hypothetical protein
MPVPSMGFTFASARGMRRLHEAAHNYRGDGAQRDRDIEGHRLRCHGGTRFGGNLGLLGVRATGRIGHIHTSSHLDNLGRPYKSPRERERYSNRYGDGDGDGHVIGDAGPAL